MRITCFSRAIAGCAVLVALLAGTGGISAAVPGAAAEETLCFDGALARTRTEVDTDIAVQQFDGTLGTLLEVSVSGPSVHLDTDAVFESTAGSPVVFAEHMEYQLIFTSPGGLASPPPVTGTIQRVPSQTLAAFDGTLDFLGPSAVTQPSTARDESAGSVSATDAPVLAAFTGSGTVPFHLATAISETFTGGGGNVQAQINTFVAAGVRVCYRYALPPDVVPESPPAPPAAPPIAPPAAPPPAPPAAPPTLPATASSSAPLAGLGAALVALGAVLARRWRAPRPRFDL